MSSTRTPEELVVRRIRIADTAPHPKQPRKKVKGPEFEKLKKSLRTHGQREIATAIRAPAGSKVKYWILAGQRRRAGLKAIGRKTIKLEIRESQGDRKDRIAMHVSNDDRADIDKMDRAQSYREHMQDFGLTQKQLADDLGKTPGHVGQYLALLELKSKRCIDAVRDKRIPLLHAVSISILPTAALEWEVGKIVIANKLSLEATRLEVKKVIARENAQSNGAPKRRGKRGSRPPSRPAPVMRTPRSGRPVNVSADGYYAVSVLIAEVSKRTTAVLRALGIAYHDYSPTHLITKFPRRSHSEMQQLVKALRSAIDDLEKLEAQLKKVRRAALHS